MTDQEQIEAIAELLGYQYHKPGDYEIKSGSYYQFEPHYLTSIDACKELIEAMRKEGFVCCLINSREGPWECSFHTHTPGKVVHPVMEPTPERAICRAFLEHHGKWKE